MDTLRVLGNFLGNVLQTIQQSELPSVELVRNTDGIEYLFKKLIAENNPVLSAQVSSRPPVYLL